MTLTPHDIGVAILSIPILVVLRFFSLTIPYTNQGFFCDDDEIRYPDREGAIDSESMIMLYAVITIILVPLSEYSLARRLNRPLHRVYKPVHPVLLKTFFFYATYTCGVLATSVATNVFKRTSSRLRPNFIAVCQPAHLDQLCPLGSNAFVENFTCLGESRPDQHFSFPSSHASHSLYFAVYTIFFLHRRFRFTSIVRSFVQYGVFVLSVFICLSRVRDFKHRYADVLGGGLLGAAIAGGMIHLILFNFRPHRYRVIEEDVSSIDTEYLLPLAKTSPYGSISSIKAQEVECDRGYESLA